MSALYPLTNIAIFIPLVFGRRVANGMTSISFQTFNDAAPRANTVARPIGVPAILDMHSKLVSMSIKDKHTGSAAQVFPADGLTMH